MLFSSLLLIVLIAIILLINHWDQNKGVVYLVVLIFVVSIRQLILLLLFSKEKSDFVVYIYTQWDPIFTLIGPSIYYYFRSIMKGRFDFSLAALIHLVPFVLIFINTFPYYLLPKSVKLELINYLRYGTESEITSVPYLFIQGRIQKYAIALMNLSYVVYSIYYVYQCKRSGTTYLKKKVSVLLNKILLVLGICVSSFLIFGFYIFQTYSGHAEKTLNGAHFLVLLILPISIFLFPSWLYGEQGTRSLFDRLSEALKITFRNTAVSETLSNTKTEDLDRIIAYITDSKPYLMDNFSLHDISRALNIPHVRVTNCFNKQLKVSFPVYRNKLRVDYATTLLATGVYLNTSIEGIAAKSGFKSKSAFYLAFKAEYGLTPVDWIKENL